MTSIELDMIQTAGIGALALIVGMVLTRKVGFLQKFCIPSPVSGGIIFSLFTLILYGWFDVEVSFDNTLSDVFMLAFFPMAHRFLYLAKHTLSHLSNSKGMNLSHVQYLLFNLKEGGSEPALVIWPSCSNHYFQRNGVLIDQA
jgi:hypothetical protein